MPARTSTSRKKRRNSSPRTKRVARKKSAPTAVAVEENAKPDGQVPWLTVVGARQNNLRGIDVAIPLQRFVCVTGVSGSGKSSLVNDILRETLNRNLNGAEKVQSGDHDAILGYEELDKVIDIDQSPIGRTPRSNPATYIKVFDEIRNLYARLPDAKIRGYKPGRFSFNVATGAGGGRCEACEGNGSNRMEMELLADVWITCPVCGGHRFNRETLQIHFKGKTIADVLEMDVQEALNHFENVPKIAGMLTTLHDVGLDYLKLGQSSTTLSGGEAQRIKLARELVKKSTGRTLYILDEPTTGLHFHDIRRLLAVLHGFVDAGNTVIVIEHNLDVIKTADWIVDLGPEGGAGGGRVVAQGTPEQVMKSKTSHTGIALRDVLKPRSSSTSKINTQTAKERPGRQIVRNGETKTITVVGARQHNLKDITVEIPRGQTSICAGPSGSGKSSFAIDTVYAEGQRRYIESLSAYARQFLGRLQPPRVEHIHGLSPAVCIEQKNTSKSPRSTVGTVTEIFDYMRVMWARIGTPYCPDCKLPIGTATSEEIVARLMEFDDGHRLMLLAPVSPSGQETWSQLLERQKANGFRRARIDGVVHLLDDAPMPDARRDHRVELVIDRVKVQKSQTSRIAESVELALAMGQGVMIAADADETDKPIEMRFSRHRACNHCGRSFEELTPHHFSFNTRMGWCESCEGLGTQQGASASAVVVHPTRSILDGALAGWEDVETGTPLHRLITALARHIGFDPSRPWNELSEAHKSAVLQGCGEDWIEIEPASGSRKAESTDTLHGMRFQWRGFFPAIARATRASWHYRKQLEELVTDVPCSACGGGRLSPEPAAVRVGNATLHEVSGMPLGEALEWFDRLRLDARQRRIAGELLHEVTSRLRFLVDVGLDYVTLHRTAATLSGGEAQRIQLAAQIGTGLTGVLYVLDEPTIGLHPRDNNRLIGALHKLRDLGNTLLLVEHDREIIDAADHVLDFGPGAGTFGGTITAEGKPKAIRRKKASLTGKYLSGKEAIPVPTNRRAVPPEPRLDLVPEQESREGEIVIGFDDPETRPRGKRKTKSKPRRSHGATRAGDGMRWLSVIGAREHNLREINVTFPLGRFICVTGVSGSGKSTLVNEVLYNALAARIHRARTVPGGHERIVGVEHIDKVINVDQAPIGNSPTSNPATYTGVFDAIRELFARLPLSRVRGYTVNRFSFNRPGGRCEACAGMGQRCIEMHFLPDVWIECEDCHGSRYVTETLDVNYREKSIADVLAMRISAALELFQNVPRIRRMLQTLDDVGLGYLELGQAAPTLSGGEAQRVKLAAELGRPSTGKTLYILDEPTTGLHFDDLRKLLDVLHRLVDMGNTCICIEHNLDVIKTADHVIDLGPEAGKRGGDVVATGTPEGIARVAESLTGKALAPVLAAGPLRERKVDLPTKQAQEELEAAPLDPELDELKMPWEEDGKKWHTVDHVDSQGEPVGWDTDLLVWLVETIEAQGSFSPTDWNHRTRIEITASRGKEWFAHFLTGGKDLLDLTIRVPRGTFTQQALDRKLKVRTLDERGDLPIYGTFNRARVRDIDPEWQQVRLSLRDFVDVGKAAFKTFIKTAVQAYIDKIGSKTPGRGKAWKTNGRDWHLTQQAMAGRHVPRWTSSTLMTLIGRFAAIQPDILVDWNHQTAVQLRVPGEDKPAGKIVTNMGDAIRVELRSPPGLMTPAMIDKLGLDPEIKRRPEWDSVIFRLRKLDQTDQRQLADVWHHCRSVGKDERLRSA